MDTFTCSVGVGTSHCGVRAGAGGGVAGASAQAEAGAGDGDGAGARAVADAGRGTGAGVAAERRGLVERSGPGGDVRDGGADGAEQTEVEGEWGIDLRFARVLAVPAGDWDGLGGGDCDNGADAGDRLPVNGAGAAVLDDYCELDEHLLAGGGALLKRPEAECRACGGSAGTGRKRWGGGAAICQERDERGADSEFELAALAGDCADSGLCRRNADDGQRPDVHGDLSVHGDRHDIRGERSDGAGCGLRIRAGGV